MKYHQNEYKEQTFLTPQTRRLTKRVKVTCSHCRNTFFASEATLYCWPDRQGFPLQGMVVNCDKCGCRNLLPQDSNEPQTTTSNKAAKKKRCRNTSPIVFIGCILILLCIGGFALKNALGAPGDNTVYPPTISDVPDDIEDTEEEELTRPGNEPQADDAQVQNDDDADAGNAVYELRVESGVSGALKKGTVADVDSTVFGNNSYKREDISRIEFLNSAVGCPTDAWDVSADGSGAILAWVDDGDCLYIASNGMIKLSGDCTGLFAYFTNVSEIAFHGWVNTEDVTDMSLLFYHCENLRSVDFEGFDTSSTTSMDRMFAGCERLTTLDLSGFDTENVTDMYGMFAHCQQLVSLDVSSFNTSNVCNMEHLFQDCATIQELDIRSFQTSNVESGNSMFYQCYNLQSLLFDVERFDTGNMTSMYAMFARCDNLRSLDVSHFDTSNVKNMAYMFNQDAYLRELAYDRFDMSNVTDKTNMLSGTIWQE